MLQIDITPFASDALEDAMRLAQTKSLNSYTFSDCMSFLNYAWSDIYNRIISIDAGYYSKTVRLTKRLTKLPPFVKNAIHVYAALQQQGYNRLEYRPSSQSDLNAARTFSISGTDLYCPDAECTTIWLEYVPQPAQIFFTHHNRDPKIIDQAYISENGIIKLSDTTLPVRNKLYNLYELKAYYMHDDGTAEQPDIKEHEYTWTDAANWELQPSGSYILKTPEGALDIDDIAGRKIEWRLCNRGTGDAASADVQDITDSLIRETEYGEWKLCFISCEFPYIFLSWEHSITGEHVSGFLSRDMSFTEYNPFAFLGTNSNVVYLKCGWNDKTGMGVTIQDFNDIIDDEKIEETVVNKPRVKELGWTPDTKLIYPAPEVYRYLVARLADKFAALNESNVMGVQKELVESSYAFEAFLSKNKASMSRMINVNPVSPSDWL